MAACGCFRQPSARFGLNGDVAIESCEVTEYLNIGRLK